MECLEGVGQSPRSMISEVSDRLSRCRRGNQKGTIANEESGRTGLHGIRDATGVGGRVDANKGGGAEKGEINLDWGTWPDVDEHPRNSSCSTG